MDGMGAQSYVANQPYTCGPWKERDPEMISNIQLLNLHPVEAPTLHDFPPSHFACPGFFQSDPGLRTSADVNVSEWDYSMRRKAQKILPFLYLGPLSAARDINFLQGEGITLLLAIRSRHSAHSLILNADKTADLLGIESDHIDVSGFQELISVFPDAIRRINNHICRCPHHLQSSPLNGAIPQKKVLVFCETGNERSACIVSAYIMAMLNLSPLETITNIQGRRLCVNIDIPTRELLVSFNTILDAQRDVTRAQRNDCDIYPSANGVTTYCQSRKRSFDPGDSDDDIMDADSGPTRIPPAPFREI